jgi:hypothetical protein
MTTSGCIEDTCSGLKNRGAPADFSEFKFLIKGGL